MTTKHTTIRFGIKVDKVALDKLEKRISSIGRRAQKFGRRLTQIGGTLTRSIALPMAAAGGAVLKFGADFEYAMNQVQAKTMASEEDMTRLGDRAKELGIRTQFSASQAAGAMIEFAKAGLSVNQILDATGNALDFAAASGLEMSVIANITAKTMSQFGLKAADAGRISDVLSKAANSATTDVSELSEALVYAGNVAGVSGVSLEETAGVLAALAAKGTVGSMAGTSLAQALVKLKNPSGEAKKVFKSLGLTQDTFMTRQGKLKMSITDVFKTLSKSGITSGQIYKVFEARAGRSVEAIINDLGNLDKMQKTVANSAGFAGKQAEITMKGGIGAWRAFKSAVEGAGIAISESGILESFTGILKKVAEFFRWVAKLDKRFLKFISGMMVGSVVIAGLLVFVGKAVTAFGFLSIALSGATAAATPLLATLGIIALKVAVVSIAIGAILAAAFLVYDDINAMFEGKPSVFNTLVQWAKSAVDEIKVIFSEFDEWLGKEVFGFFESFSGRLLRIKNELFGNDEPGDKKETVERSIKEKPFLSKASDKISSIWEFIAAPSKTGDVAKKAAMAEGGPTKSAPFNVILPSGKEVKNVTEQHINISPTVNLTYDPKEGSTEAVSKALNEEITRSAKSAAQSLKPAYSQ